MVRGGKVSDLGGGYITFVHRPGAVVTNATSRVPTNIPPLAGLISVTRLQQRAQATQTLATQLATQYTIRAKTATLGGAARVCLVDYRTIRFQPTSSAKHLFVVVGRLAPIGYTGAGDDLKA